MIIRKLLTIIVTTFTVCFPRGNSWDGMMSGSSGLSVSLPSSSDTDEFHCPDCVEEHIWNLNDVSAWNAIQEK